MVYLIVANMYEAKPFIKRLCLEKDESHEIFEMYSKQEYMLLVTRPGLILSAIAVTYFLAQRRPSTRDIIINVGLCIATRQDYTLGAMYMCYKIIEAESGRKLFPDFLFQHPFQEAGVTSINCQCVRSADQDFSETFQTELVDMEASSIFQVVLAITKTHNAYFFRIVAGYGERTKINSIQGERLIEAHVNEILEWVNDINSKGSKEYEFTYEEIRGIKNLSKHLLLSPIREQELFQYLFYYKTENHDVESLISDYMGSIKNLDIFTRAEGKKYYDEIFKNINLNSGGKQNEN